MKRSFRSGLCPLCGGARVTGLATYSADLGSGVVVVRRVPATVCEQCGEQWIDDTTAEELHRLTEDARQRGAQVEVTSLP